MPRSAASRASASFATPAAITSTNTCPASVTGAASSPQSSGQQRGRRRGRAPGGGPAACPSDGPRRGRRTAGTSPRVAARPSCHGAPRMRARCRTEARAPAERHAGHSLPQAFGDARSDRGRERLEPHDPVIVEVVDRRAVGADRDPADPRGRGDVPHRSRGACGHDHDRDPGLPRGAGALRVARDGRSVGAACRRGRSRPGGPSRRRQGVRHGQDLRRTPRRSAQASSRETSMISVPRRATIRPNPPAAARSAAAPRAASRRDVRSAALGVPPRYVTEHGHAGLEAGHLLQPGRHDRRHAAEALEAERRVQRSSCAPGGGSIPSATTTTE